MNFNFNFSYWICLLILVNLILNCQRVRAQDTISVLDQNDEARFMVSEIYTFTLNSNLENISSVVWSISGAVEFDKNDFEIINIKSNQVFIQFSPDLINPQNLKKSPENIYLVKATYGTPERQTVYQVNLINEGKLFLMPPKLNVSSDIGKPPVRTNRDTTVLIEPGEQITFTANLPPNKTNSDIIWAAVGPNTFGGSIFIDPNTPNKLIYTAINLENQTLTTGSDVISVTDGTTIIVITIFVNDILADSIGCDTTKPLNVVPGKDDFVTVEPLSSITFTAEGGTCTYLWSLTANNSQVASLVRTDSIHATYTAGSFENTVDTIELTDGLTTFQIDVLVSKTKSRNSSNGCFLKNTTLHRD